MPGFARSRETQPLLRTAEEPEDKHCLPPWATGRLCAGAVVATLVAAWCTLHIWSHTIRSQLFNMDRVPTKLNLDSATGQASLSSDFQNFSFPMTLALIQLAFIGSACLFLWCLCSSQPRADLLDARASLTKSHWAALGVSQIFTVFCVQALVLPTLPGTSIGAWAAAHAVEVPTCAALRSKVMGTPYGGHAPATTGLMCVAALSLFVAYSKIAECLCAFTGSGMALAGPALYALYALNLTVPVANIVFQEAAVVQLRTPPLLLLAMQNFTACAIFLPIVVGAAFLSVESPIAVLCMIVSSREVRMLVVWSCVQATALAGVCLLTTLCIDSFWTVALHSLRVVFWWAPTLYSMYSNTGMLLSVADPVASFWSFVMLCGLFLVAGAAFVDRPMEVLKGAGMSQKEQA